MVSVKSKLILKQGREKSLLRRHPWIFTGAVQRLDGSPASGETIDVLAANGEWLASAAYSPQSQIVARVWSWSEGEEISPQFFRQRIAESAARRRPLESLTNAVRLVNAESDGLPGLVVDRYDDYCVCQFLSAGADYWKSDVALALREVLQPRGVIERSDVDVRAKEGLPEHVGVLQGTAPATLTVREGDCKFVVDMLGGHKTGFYLDQRDNRLALTPFVSGLDVLNCFAYTGGFGVWALMGGAAHVTNVDISPNALALAGENFRLNHFSDSQFTLEEADVFSQLRKYRDARRQYDLIILDPPKFAASRNQLNKATSGYKDINLLAFKLLRAGGLLYTFSCSGIVTADLFQKIVAGAALDAGRDVQIIGRMTQAPDHPVATTFPEGDYLKGLICRV